MKELNSLLQSYVDKGFFQGFQWNITVNKKSFFDKVGYMDLETKEPIKENTIYRIWSMTKPIVSIAIMQLVENQKINLTDTIDKYINEFSDLKVLKNMNSEINELSEINNLPTIKDLLMHTGGFTYHNYRAVGREYLNKKLFFSQDTTLEEEINILSKIPLLYQPGTKWKYSVSTDILARVLEVVINKPLQVILKENIFNPLKMNDTKFNVDEINTARVMKSYNYSKNDSRLKNIDLNDPENIPFGYPLNKKTFARGGHGLFSTIDDYVKFANMLLDGKSTDGTKIIEKKTIDTMSVNNLTENLLPIEIKSEDEEKDKNYQNSLRPYGWGLGFRSLMSVEKNENFGSIGEFGWAGAANTYFIVDPKKNLTATIMSQVTSPIETLNRDFYKFVYSNF